MFPFNAIRKLKLFAIQLIFYKIYFEKLKLDFKSLLPAVNLKVL